MWHAACLLCYYSGCFCILNQCSCRSKKMLVPWQHQYTPAAVCVCSLSGWQADRRRALRAWEGQMFPCRHRGEMFAMPGLCLPGSPQSHRLPARCPEPVSAGGKEPGVERGARIYTEDEGATTNVLCVSPEAKRNTSHTTLSSVERSLFIPQTVCWCEGGWGCLVSLEARLNVRTAMEAADLTNLP